MANHVRARRKALGLTQEKVAQAVGTTKATVMKLEKGMMQLTESWLNRLSVPLQCRPTDLIAEDIPQDVPVVGEIAEGGALSFYIEWPAARGAAEPDPDSLRGLEHIARPPEGGYRHVMALKVTGNALEPLLACGSYLYYAEPLESGFESLQGQLVVCATEEERYHIGRLQAGEEFGSFNLIAPDGTTLRALQPNWCAKVIFLKP